jgi:hypothetical protein
MAFNNPLWQDDGCRNGKVIGKADGDQMVRSADDIKLIAAARGPIVFGPVGHVGGCL